MFDAIYFMYNDTSEKFIQYQCSAKQELSKVYRHYKFSMLLTHKHKVMVNILSSFLRAIITVIFCSVNFTYTYILWKPLLIKIPVFHSQINNAIKLTILLYITVRPPFDLIGWKTPKNIKISENNQHLAHSWLAYKIQKKLVSICTKLSHKTRIMKLKTPISKLISILFLRFKMKSLWLETIFMW